MDILEEIYMEMIYYRCPVCGFTYQVPAYWSDFSPEEKTEMEHINLKTNEICGESMLELIKE